MMSEALHFELKHFGIKVILIEAGSIKTDMPVKQKHFTSKDYEALDEQMKKRFDDYLKEDKRNPPEKIANIIVDVIEDPNSGFKIPVGQDAEYIISQRLKLSDEEWEKSSMFKDLNW